MYAPVAHFIAHLKALAPAVEIDLNPAVQLIQPLFRRCLLERFCGVVFLLRFLSFRGETLFVPSFLNERQAIPLSLCSTRGENDPEAVIFVIASQGTWRALLRFFAQIQAGEVIESITNLLRSVFRFRGISSAAP